MRKVRKNLDILVIAVGIVLIWRGIWGLADMYLLPQSPLISFAASIALGVAILYLHNPKQGDIREIL